jgi:hypothetical protein
MDTDYQRAVNAQGKRQLLRKLATQPDPERLAIPSVHYTNAKKVFKDRKTVAPDRSSQQFLCDGCAGAGHSGGKFNLKKLGSDALNVSKKIVRIGVPAMVGVGTTLEAGPAAGLAAARASSELTNLITGGKSKVGGRSSGGRSSGGSAVIGGSAATDRRKTRGQMVSKLMREKQMTLGQASAHIKAHKLL